MSTFFTSISIIFTSNQTRTILFVLFYFHVWSNNQTWKWNNANKQRAGKYARCPTWQSRKNHACRERAKAQESFSVLELEVAPLTQLDHLINSENSVELHTCQPYNKNNCKRRTYLKLVDSSKQHIHFQSNENCSKLDGWRYLFQHAKKTAVFLYSKISLKLGYFLKTKIT